MSTRAVYTFKDDYDTFAIYGHHDGYAAGAAEFLNNAISKSWGLGRFEASDFAAAFVAANKTGGGSFRLTKGRTSHFDLQYDYVVHPDKGGNIVIEAYQYHYVDGIKKHVRFFKGPLTDFIHLYYKKEEDAHLVA